jgi:hypothetical protein
MWFLIFLGLTIYYLRQIITWTLPSFRQGIVVHKYIEPFPRKIPKDLINREIDCDNIPFIFISQNKGIFRANQLQKTFILLKNRRKTYFPSLLGEVELDHKGTAQVTLRIPLPMVLISVALFIVMTISNMKGVLTINSLILGILESGFVMIVLGIFSTIGFFMEKDDLHDGIIILKEYLNT